MFNYITSLVGIMAIVAILGIAKHEFGIPEEITATALFSCLNFCMWLIRRRALHILKRRVLLIQGFSFLFLAVVTVVQYLNHGIWEISYAQLIGFGLIAPIYLLINTIVEKYQKREKTE